MKSIQTKIILLILVGIVVSSAIIGGAGIINANRVIDNNSVQIMNLLCKEKAGELNNVLCRIEQSVEVMAVYAVENLESKERLITDEEYRNQYTRDMEELGLTIANATDGVVTIYARFNPEITGPKEGFFRVKSTATGEFEWEEPTDFTMYSPDDVEHVGWYYIPVQAGKAVWMQPYYNQNIDIYMISYVIPIYKDNELIGIVGMDIDFGLITGLVDGIQVYNTGHAFLTDENFYIVHSAHYLPGTQIREFSEALATADADDITGMDILYEHTLDGEKKKVAFQALENGMCLAVTVPVSEIDSSKNVLVTQVLVSSFVISVVFIFITAAIAETIIRPLKELNVAAKKVADGNLDVLLTCKSKDEVGTLTESLRETVNQLKIRIDYINGLAYIDKLTGCKNNTAYLQTVSEIQEEIQKGESSFSIFIADINGLKAVNDAYGHACGNELIIEVSRALVEVFGNDCVYRIGGDEFAVVLKNAPAEGLGEMESKFEGILKMYDGKIKLSAAIGSASYDKTQDKDYGSVFEHADERMYAKKLQMKEQGDNSRIEE